MFNDAGGSVTFKAASKTKVASREQFFDEPGQRRRRRQRRSTGQRQRRYWGQQRHRMDSVAGEGLPKGARAATAEPPTRVREAACSTRASLPLPA